MKSLYLMRHGKAEAYGNGADADRQLAKKGEEQARKMGTYFRQHGIKPALVVSSHATRAVTTVSIMVSELNIPVKEIKIYDFIYHKDADALHDFILDLDDSVDSVLLVGHNPTVSDFVNHFIQPQTEGLPTGALAAIKFNTKSWKEISKHTVQSSVILLPGAL